MKWLAEFRAHFENVWLPTRAIEYFTDKDPAAVPYLTVLLPPPEGDKERPSLSWSA